MKSKTDAKKYIKNKILPLIPKDEPKAGVPRPLRKELFNLIEKYDPELMKQFSMGDRGLTVKKHLIYCFLNDLPINKFTKYFIIDDGLNRIVDEISLRDYAHKFINSSSAETFYLSSLAKHGFDLKFPQLEHYHRERISKILKRLRTKHGNCSVCKKYFKIKHKGHTVCDTTCQAKLSSERMKVENPSQIYYNEIFTEAYKRRHSERMKSAISCGDFTPNITNSWANSKIYIKLFDMNFRSSWEAYFFLFMSVNGIDIGYEKTRIKYFDSQKGKERNYITDFTDFNENIIYEIKPYSKTNELNAKEKEAAAKKWCKANKFRFEYITEKWFRENYNVKLLHYKRIDKENREKLKKCLRQFEK